MKQIVVWLMIIVVLAGGMACTPKTRVLKKGQKIPCPVKDC